MVPEKKLKRESKLLRTWINTTSYTTLIFTTTMSTVPPHIRHEYEFSLPQPDYRL